jgi:hypothetical protein
MRMKRALLLQVEEGSQRGGCNALPPMLLAEPIGNGALPFQIEARDVTGKLPVGDDATSQHRWIGENFFQWA